MQIQIAPSLQGQGLGTRLTRSIMTEPSDGAQIQHVCPSVKNFFTDAYQAGKVAV
jgi:hypothetical protein